MTAVKKFQITSIVVLLGFIIERYIAAYYGFIKLGYPYNVTIMLLFIGIISHKPLKTRKLIQDKQ